MTMKKLKKYEKINLINFEYVKEKSSHLAAPGIYAIFCEATERAYIDSSSNVLESLESQFDEILDNYYQGPMDLLLDLKKFDLGRFWFIILAIGPELKTFPKRQAELHKTKANWPYGIY